MVEFRAAAMGRSTTYRLKYDYTGAPGRLAWELLSGDLERELDGCYLLSASPDAPGFDRHRLRAGGRPDRADPRLRQAPGRGPHHQDGAVRAEGPRRGRGARPGAATTCPTRSAARCASSSSPAKAASARPRWPPRRPSRSADAGRRTLIISTDPAHSLADSFGVDLGSSPTRIAKRLKGQQLDAQSRMEESWDEIQRWLVDVFNWAGVDAIEAEELAVVPGLDEVFALGDIKTYAESGDWDTLVVDCAPTAETIRLLSLPDILSWYMERVFPAGRRVNRMLGPVLSRVTNLPVAGDEVFGATRRFYDRLDGVKEVLSDRERTSVRLVVNPERMVIAEARRTYTYLSLFGYRVDAVIANRLLPDEVTDPWFAQWRAAQAKHMDTIDRGLLPVADPEGASRRRRDRRRRSAAALRRGGLLRRRSARGAARPRPDGDRRRRRREGARARAAVRRPRRRRRRSAGRRAARQRRSLPSRHHAAGLVASPRRDRGQAPQGEAPHYLWRPRTSDQPDHAVGTTR